MGPNLFTCMVTRIEHIAADTVYIAAESGQLGREVRPGQFVMLRVGAGADPLLRRPFSVCAVDDSEVSFLVRLCGKGTALMAQWRCGDRIDVLGPLGNGFVVSRTLRQAILVGGGIGVAPLIGLAQHCERRFPEMRIRLYMGAAEARFLVSADRFALDRCEVFTATDDGSAGYHGTVTDFVARHLQDELSSGGREMCLYGCGPAAMARELARIAHTHSLECRLSLESRMACGTGACLGCVIPVTDSDALYKRVCADGPVFDSRSIDWDRIPR